MRSFLRGFVYAFNGIYAAVKQERNFRFHLCAAVYIYALSAFYPFDKTQYVLITILIAGVLALELVNSALERTVSRPSPKRYVTAGVVKDMAAGAVLVFSIGAAACGFILFWDIERFVYIANWFIDKPVAFILLVASLVASWWFIFMFGRPRTKKGDSI